MGCKLTPQSRESEELSRTLPFPFGAVRPERGTTIEDIEQESGADYVPDARSVLAAVPALLREAEATGAITLARFLGRGLSEAEGIERRADHQPTVTVPLA